MSYLFDDLDSDGGKAYRSQKPIWALNLDSPDSEKDILNWLRAESCFLEEENQNRIKTIQKNVALYKGVQYESQDVNRSSMREIDDKQRNIKKIVVNHIYDLTENKVSRIVKYRPAIAVIPTNDEWADKVSSKVVKMLIDHIWYVEHFDSRIVPEVVKDNFISGESYLWITWDPKKGDVHPDFDKNKKIPMVDENGQEEKDENGKTIYLDKVIHIGDVKYEIVSADNVLIEPKARFSEANYCFKKKLYRVEELRQLYPDKADKIKATRNVQVYDYDKMSMRQLNNEVMVWEFWHKKNEFLEEGRKIVYTADVILENDNHPNKHGDFPFERLTDIDVPGEVHGMSFFQNIKQLAALINNLTTMIARNQFQVGHPKWVYPAGSCKIESLANDITVVQFKGPVEPKLIQMNPTPAEVFNFRELAKTELQTIGGVFGVSRGEPPKGVEAGIALQFLAEQEQERYNLTILKFNEWVRSVALKTIAVASDFYDVSDNRMLRVVGKNNQWMITPFDAASLTTSYDVIIQNSSALPQSKAARMQFLIDLKQQFPQMVSDEQFLDLLDMSQSETFIDIATVAVRTAEAEVEDLLAGKDVPQPEEYDDLITKWKIYAKTPQAYTFKRETPVEVRAKYLAYLGAVEMLMMDKAKKNPAFAQSMMTLVNFPLVMTPMEAQQVMGPPQEQAPAPEMNINTEQETVNTGLAPGAESQIEQLPNMEQQLAMESQIPQAAPIEPTSSQ